MSTFPNAHAVSERSAIQRGSIVWARSYGGPGETFVSSVRPTRDGGYIAAGWIYGPVTTNAWVFKLDSLGNIDWQEAISQWQTQDWMYFTYADSAIQAPDDGYLVIGGGGFHDRFGCCNSWLAKLDTRGAVEWIKDTPTIPRSVDLTRDNEFILAGESITYEMDRTSGWLEKINLKGDGWVRSYSVSGFDVGISSAHETSDGGFIAAGHFLNDLWVFKTDQYGTILWQKNYDSPGALSILETGNISRQISNNSESDPPRVASSTAPQTRDSNVSHSGFIVLAGEVYGQSTWIVRLDDRGNILWDTTYGNSASHSMAEASPGEYVIAGSQTIFKINNRGDILWSRAFEGLTPNTLISIVRTQDLGFVLAGRAGYTLPSHDGGRAWVVKINSEGICCKQMTTNAPTTVDSALIHAGSANATAGQIVAAGGPNIYYAIIASNTTVQTQCSPSRVHF